MSEFANVPPVELLQGTAALLEAARFAVESEITRNAAASFMADERVAEQGSWPGIAGTEAHNLNQQLRALRSNPLQNWRFGHLAVSRPAGRRYMIDTPLLLLHEPEDIGMYDGGTYQGDASLATGYTATGFGIASHENLDELNIHRWLVDMKSGERQPVGGYNILFEIDEAGPHSTTIAGDGFTEKLVEILDRRVYGKDVELPMTKQRRIQLYMESKADYTSTAGYSGEDVPGHTIVGQNYHLTRRLGITGENFPDELYHKPVGILQAIQKAFSARKKQRNASVLRVSA